MASSTDPGPSSSPSAPPNRPRSDFNRGGRGRGRGRGASMSNVDDSERINNSNDGRGGRRGRGNRGGGHWRSGSNTINTADPTARPLQPSASKSPPEPAQVLNTEPAKQVQAGPQEEETEAEVCFICASPVIHHSVPPCNHRTCHICALRMRALYKTKDCPHCRSESQYVIFTDDATKRYEEFSEADLVNTDENIGIKYENNEIVEDTVLLLHYNCPDPDCPVASLGWPDLHRHVRKEHHKKMCDLCTRNKKVFTHEHELFTDKELERHMKKGDDNPGAVDQSGFKGHPLCGFCGQRFYGDDELFQHCRSNHERCFICDRRDGRQPQYYLNYEALVQHFRKDHFMCSERECLEKKFVVFASEIDLKAHQLEEHSNTLSKDVRRDARTVDMSSFDYRAPYVQERRGGASQREGRGRGRGRDPNAEPIPASSAQPLRRDEQAFQRQMAIHTAQSVSNRTFGGQLTSTPAPSSSASGPTNVAAPRPTELDTSTSELASLDINDNNLTPQEHAKRLRHAAVIDRATVLLQNDQMKLNQFRNSISSYRKNAISAAGLIDSFFALFSDTSSSSLGSLVRDIADLYEDAGKAEALRNALNDWRAINEDYPSLPGPSGLSNNPPRLGWAQVTSSTPSTSQPTQPKNPNRVLKLKSSTVQSSRSTQSRTASWSSASSTPANPFPSLPPQSSNQIIRPGPLPGRVSTTPWLEHASTSNPPSAPASAPTSRPASRGPGKNVLGGGSDAFPALPPAPKPTSTIFGYGRGMVRRDVGGSPGSFTWGSGGAAGGGISEMGTDTANMDADVQVQGKKKGNKGKKQVLVQWG